MSRKLLGKRTRWRKPAPDKNTPGKTSATPCCSRPAPMDLMRSSRTISCGRRGPADHPSLPRLTSKASRVAERVRHLRSSRVPAGRPGHRPLRPPGHRPGAAGGGAGRGRLGGPGPARLSAGAVAAADGALQRAGDRRGRLRRGGDVHAGTPGLPVDGRERGAGGPPVAARRACMCRARPAPWTAGRGRAGERPAGGLTAQGPPRDCRRPGPRLLKSRLDRRQHWLTLATRKGSGLRKVAVWVE
jgi:translation initiation factor IF-2